MANSPSFLGIDPEDRARRVAILPLPYEGTVSWLGGTAAGPGALLAASTQVELYDERLGVQITDRVDVRTYAAPDMPASPAAAIAVAQRSVGEALARGSWPVAIGGEHSLSLGVYRALALRGPDLGVVQIDAHADLREEYEGEPLSHACVMARIREHTDAVVQLGIRSLSKEEAEVARERRYLLGTMHALRSGRFDADAALESLPERVFLTFDVDALALSLVRATGTPEPGGFEWDEILALLGHVFRHKTVVGVDVMELGGGDPASAF